MRPLACFPTIENRFTTALVKKEDETEKGERKRERKGEREG